MLQYQSKVVKSDVWSEYPEMWGQYSSWNLCLLISHLYGFGFIHLDNYTGSNRAENYTFTGTSERLDSILDPFLCLLLYYISTKLHVSILLEQ